MPGSLCGLPPGGPAIAALSRASPCPIRPEASQWRGLRQPRAGNQVQLYAKLGLKKHCQYALLNRDNATVEAGSF